MKKIKIEIPLDEAMMFHAGMKHLFSYLDENCEKSADYMRSTGAMMSLDERIHRGIINQCTLKEINSVID